MAATQSQDESVLEPHIPPEENLQASATGRGQITAVTDRRVLSVSEAASGTEQQREVESVLLTSDTVVGTRYGRTDSENRATLRRIVGIALAILGALLFFGGLQVRGDAQGLLVLLGLVVAGIGVYLYMSAEDTMEGDVSITVRRVGEIPDRTWTFPRGHTEVPQAISEQVAKIHSPD